MNGERFYLDSEGDVIDSTRLRHSAWYSRGELGFNREQTQVIADLLNEHDDPDTHTWEQIEAEWERRTT